jgi:hypothetical protein
MALTRQTVASQRCDAKGNPSARGAYILLDADDAKAVIIATGSEVEIAMNAQKALAAEGVPVRVVSMPCMELFETQDRAYQDEVLGGDPSQGGRGSRCPLRLGPLDRPRWRLCRHVQLRRQRTLQGPLQSISGSPPKRSSRPSGNRI